MKKLISIVIPAYKEEKNIGSLYEKLEEVIFELENTYNFEIIFVNDGSSDNTWLEIDFLCNKDKRVVGIDFSRNFGKEIALTAGLESSSGQAVITLDGDGQHPVEKIPLFLQEWEKGYEIVYNKRPKTNGASIVKQATSKLFYLIFNSLSEFKLEEATTDYRLLDRKVVDSFLRFREKNRSYRGLTDWLGYKKKALVFNAERRLNGNESSYSFRKLLKLALDNLTSFSLFPLKLVGYLGVFVVLISTLLALFIVMDQYLLGNNFGFSGLPAKSVWLRKVKIFSRGEKE